MRTPIVNNNTRHGVSFQTSRNMVDGIRTQAGTSSRNFYENDDNGWNVGSIVRARLYPKNGNDSLPSEISASQQVLFSLSSFSTSLYRRGIVATINQHHHHTAIPSSSTTTTKNNKRDCEKSYTILYENELPKRCDFIENYYVIQQEHHKEDSDVINSDNNNYYDVNRVTSFLIIPNFDDTDTNDNGDSDIERDVLIHDLTPLLDFENKQHEQSHTESLNYNDLQHCILNRDANNTNVHDDSNSNKNTNTTNIDHTIAISNSTITKIDQNNMMILWKQRGDELLQTFHDPSAASVCYEIALLLHQQQRPPYSTHEILQKLIGTTVLIQYKTMSTKYNNNNIIDKNRTVIVVAEIDCVSSSTSTSTKNNNNNNGNVILTNNILLDVTIIPLGEEVTVSYQDIVLFGVTEKDISSSSTIYTTTTLQQRILLNLTRCLIRLSSDLMVLLQSSSQKQVILLRALEYGKSAILASTMSLTLYEYYNDGATNSLDVATNRNLKQTALILRCKAYFILLEILKVITPTTSINTASNAANYTKEQRTVIEELCIADAEKVLKNNTTSNDNISIQRIKQLILLEKQNMKRINKKLSRTMCQWIEKSIITQDQPVVEKGDDINIKKGQVESITINDSSKIMPTLHVEHEQHKRKQQQLIFTTVQTNTDRIKGFICDAQPTIAGAVSASGSTATGSRTTSGYKSIITALLVLVLAWYIQQQHY